MSDVSFANATNVNETLAAISSPRADLQCYALPYGTLGFFSDLLTLYTAWRLSQGERPLSLGSPLTHSTWAFILNICLMIVTMTGTGATAILTIYRCSGAWEITLIAAYKLIISITMSLIGLHTALAARRSRWKRLPEQERTTEAHVNGEIVRLWWGTLYTAGALTGAIGLFTLIRTIMASSAPEDMAITSFLFWFTITFIILVHIGTMIHVLVNAAKNPTSRGGDSDKPIYHLILTPAFSTVMVFSIFFAFYCDWALASIAGDWVGYPARSQPAIFWIYFFSKRLPMFFL
jgi:hypothetical protein